MAETLTPQDIKAARKELDLTQEAFGELLHAKLRTVQSWEKGDRNMQEATALLLQQKLDAHRSAQSVVNETQSTYDIEVSHLDGLRSSIMEVPLVNQYAYAGYMNGYGDREYMETLPRIPFILDKEYKGEYLCFQAKGDSMECDSEESIPDGSILLCRNVKQEHWRNKLHINSWDFVIVHREKGIVAKRIVKHDVERGILTLHSLNSYYQDYDVHLKDVQQIFNIVEVQQKRKRR
ncbi:S24 family peptidase [Flavobacterium sp. 25HG05S-40]|uniref:S24 family peptidase n=1 Tax=Flavobacterium sp. 25HG05S-40 TaxID=3458682 RepID=UPI004044F6DE